MHAVNLVTCAVQAAQRRKAADAGPISVADIKKRKQVEQLKREMANKRHRNACGAAGARASNGGPATPGKPGGPPPPSPTGGRPTDSRPQDHRNSTGQTVTGRGSYTGKNGGKGGDSMGASAAAQRDELRSNENAHTQTATAHHQQHQVNGVGSSARKRPSSAAGEPAVGNGVDTSLRGTSQVRPCHPLVFFRSGQCSVISEHSESLLVTPARSVKWHEVPEQGCHQPNLLVSRTRCIYSSASYTFDRV